MSRPRNIIEVLILGQHYRSNLGYVNQFVSHVFAEDPYADPFLGEEPRRRQFSVDGEVSLVDILDAPIESYIENYSPYHAFEARVKASILIYDVTSRDGFDFFTERAHYWTRQDIRLASLAKDHVSPAGGVVAQSTETTSPAIYPPERNLWSPWQKLRSRLRGKKNSAKQPVAADTFTCFPRLPLEVQIAILRACLTTNHRIRDRLLHHSGVNMNVLLVCKLFYKEGSTIFWTENTFVHSKPTYLIADLTWTTTPLAGRFIPEKRRVTSAEGRALADRIGCKYFETSSTVHEEVEAVFVDLVRECRR